MNDLKRKNCDEMKKKSYFLSIGRLTKQKNHIFLINFFSKNHSYLKNHELIITGEGKLESTCRRIIDDKKLNDKIKILGYKKNVFNYINKAECIISSSLWEDPGFIMIESAFIGTPVISSDCPSGPKEFIGNNENGFIYKSGDEKNFQKILNNFLNISDRKLFRIIVNAKKKPKIYTRYYNFKKLSYLLN